MQFGLSFSGKVQSLAVVLCRETHRTSLHKSDGIREYVFTAVCCSKTIWRVLCQFWQGVALAIKQAYKFSGGGGVMSLMCIQGGSVAEWLACWTRRMKGPGSNRVATLSGNSLRQTVHTHCASVHQAAKLVAALLRAAGVTAGLADSNGSLPQGLWLTSPAG